MNKEQVLVPQLRFPEFENDGDWEETTLEKVFNIYAGGDKPNNISGIKTKEFYTPILSNGINNKALYGWTNKPKVETPSLTISARGTIGWTSIQEGPFYPIVRLIVLNPIKIDLNLKYTYYFMKTIENNYKVPPAGIPQLTKPMVKGVEIPFPKNPKEQQKIANCLSSLDTLITAQTEKLEHLKDHKKGLLQQLFPAKGETQPQLRFPEFVNDGEWKEEKLGQATTYFKGFAFKSKDYKDKGRRIVRVSDMGFDYIKEGNSAIFISKEEVSQYDRWELKEGDLIITTVGSKPPVYDSLVGRTIVVKSKEEGFLLNQNAVCLRANKLIEQQFLNTLFKKSGYIAFIETIIRGNANQGSITLDNLFQYEFLIPNPKEQQKIANCLSSLDTLITAETEKLEHLKAHKKGLMQQLFPTISELAV